MEARPAHGTLKVSIAGDHLIISDEPGQEGTCMKTIALLLPNGWGIKNYLLTDFLPTLNGRAHIIALTPLFEHPPLKTALRETPVVLEKLDVRPLKSWARHTDDFFVLAQYYRQPTTLTRLFLHYQQARSRGISRTIRGIKRLLAGTIGIGIPMEVQTFLEKRMFGFHEEMERLKHVFRKHRVDLVFSTMPLIAYFERPALWAAQACGIPVACAISSWDNLNSKGRLPIRFHHYLTWSDLMKEELLKKYPFIPPTSVTPVGPPQFDFYRRRDLLMERDAFFTSIGGDPARSLILWAAVSPNQYPNEPQIVEAFYKTLLEREGPRGPQVLVRAHPIGGIRRFERLKETCPGILLSETNPDDPTTLWKWTPSLDDVRLLVNSLYHASVTISNGSTMTLDACAMDRPVINVAYDLVPGSPMDSHIRSSFQYDHYQSVLNLKAIRMAYSQEELFTHIQSYFRDPSLEAEGRRALLKLQCGDVDGHAARRAAEALMRLFPPDDASADAKALERESHAGLDPHHRSGARLLSI